VLKNLTVNTAIPEDGADERRNSSECYSNSDLVYEWWCALNVGLMKTINE